MKKSAKLKVAILEGLYFTHNESSEQSSCLPSQTLTQLNYSHDFPTKPKSQKLKTQICWNPFGGRVVMKSLSIDGFPSCLTERTHGGNEEASHSD